MQKNDMVTDRCNLFFAHKTNAIEITCLTTGSIRVTSGNFGQGKFQTAWGNSVHETKKLKQKRLINVTVALR